MATPGYRDEPTDPWDSSAPVDLAEAEGLAGGLDDATAGVDEFEVETGGQRGDAARREGRAEKAKLRCAQSLDLINRRL